VVVSASRRASHPPQAAARAVVWHDLECGSYRADLGLWHELARRGGGPVLEIGAGTGRVALALAAAGHRVTALERDPDLLAALRARARRAGVRVVGADARRFSLERRGFAMCAVPMQTIQLLGGASARHAFLRCARAHLRPGGMLACALLAGVQPFDCAAGELGPAPETAVVGGLLHVSRPTRVRVGRRSVTIERERRIFSAPGQRPWLAADANARDELAREHSLIELERLSVRALEREGIAAGLSPAGTHEVAPTEDHVGSSVVVLHA
jgi:SAM-dependent methyltransferase